MNWSVRWKWRGGKEGRGEGGLVVMDMYEVVCGQRDESCRGKNRG